MIERRYSLRQAAKLAGVDRDVLKGLLAAELPDFPQIPRGSKYLIRESDLERALARRSPRGDPARLRLLRQKLTRAS